ELFTSIDNIEFETRTDAERKTNDVNIEKEIKSLIEKRNELSEVTEKHSKRIQRTSESFAVIAGFTTLLASVLTFVGKEKYDTFSKPLYDFLQNNDFYIGIVASVFTSILASFILVISKKINKK
ncbi:MAG TPA: hypothetical protein VJ780_02585, partial [Flavobacterium sp.]|nr:hypothetical protein [Flavobacterium sp.]